MSNSKSIFLLIIVAVIAGWIYMLLNPSHNIESNLELNATYFPAVRPDTVKGQ